MTKLGEWEGTKQVTTVRSGRVWKALATAELTGGVGQTWVNGSNREN